MMDDHQIETARKFLLNPMKFRLYLLRHLPMGLLSGMRISKVDDAQCEVKMRYRWWIKNPFHSTFWAVMGMAGEMTTGAILVTFTKGQRVPVSFILISQSARYFKKAKGLNRYVCAESKRIKQAVINAQGDNEKHPLKLPVQVFNVSGEVIAEMEFEWVLQNRGPMVEQ